MADKEKQNATAEPFKVERTLQGVNHAYMAIAERLVNGHLGHAEGREATKALDGVGKLVKTQIEAFQLYEKSGNRHVKDKAGEMIGITPKAIENKNEKD